METNAVYQETSPLDALWTIYQQQSEQVKRAFLARVRQTDCLLDMPGLRSREEMENVSKQRMRDIIAGREKTVTHLEAMKLVDKAIADAV
ncbi:MAG: hypothetical protein IJK07_04840 [Bacteroidales bacterium]|nr:hypothetical protein [Bacteroidales bacterium]